MNLFEQGGLSVLLESLFNRPTQLAEESNHSRVVIELFPLALTAKTPTMLAAVACMISLELGPMRAGMFMTGRLAADVGLCTILSIFTGRDFNLTLDGLLNFRLFLKSILGLLPVAMAVKIALGGDDPEAIPSKFVELFTRMPFLQLFRLGVLGSLFQVRHILMMFMGITFVQDAGRTIRVYYRGTVLTVHFNKSITVYANRN